MTKPSTVRSWGAIVLGGVCAVGTFAVLFWHVRSPADITTNHVMIGLALIVTLGAGHFMWSSAELSLSGFVRFCSFLLLFVAGTAVCVTLSGGRSAEAMLRKEMVAKLENGARTAQEVRIIEAKETSRVASNALVAAEAASKEAAEKAAEGCASGPGPKCKGATLTAEAAKQIESVKRHLATQADSHHWLLVGELSNMGPEQVANADLRQIAKVIALWKGGDYREIMKDVELLWSYALALITEFGTIAFLNYGFSHNPRVVTVTAPELPKQEVPVLAAGPPPDLPLIAALKKVKRPVTNDEVAELMECSKGEASRRVSALINNGTVRRSRNGRYVEISLSQLH